MTRVSNHLVAWGISAALHLLLLLLVLPPGGRFDGRGIRQYEVGWVEIFEIRGSPVASPAGRPSEGLRDKSDPMPALRTESREKQTPVQNKPAGTRNVTSQPPKTDLPAKDPDSPNKEASEKGRSGGSISLGSGEQFVIARPVYYPKNAQNEGVAGKVKIALILSVDGSVQATILESSGDDRLDRYSIRAVTEAWKYARPATSIRILVSLVFSGDRAEVIFEGTEAWDGEGT